MLTIFYDDEQIVVCSKPVGVASQGDAPGAMPERLRSQLGCGAIFPVHRLDQTTGGVMVYAKTAQAASALSQQLPSGRMQKEYLAVLRGLPAQPHAELRDFLYHDRNRNKTFVVKPRAGAREAHLSYQVLSQAADGAAGTLCLVRIKLYTGRTHQIRAQFSARRLPLLGDGKYGGGDNRCTCALWSYRLSFCHPQSGAPMTVTCLPPQQFPWNAFLMEGL